MSTPENPRPRRRVDFGIARHRLLAHVLPGRQRTPPVLQRGRGPLAAVWDPFTSTPRPSQVSVDQPDETPQFGRVLDLVLRLQKNRADYAGAPRELARIPECRRVNSSPCRL